MKKNIYLALAILGFILPYTQFVPWTNQYGFDFGFMVEQMFANQIASGIALDALVIAVVIVIFILFEQRQDKVKFFWVPIVTIFLSGIALALPLYLYLRELTREKKWPRFY